MTTTALSKTKSISLFLPQINWKGLYLLVIIFSLIVFLFSLIFYVFCVNGLTSGSYTIKNYEKEIKILAVTNTKLEMAYAKAGFLGQVQQKAHELNFEKIKNIKYIQVLDLSLAKAK